MSYQVALLGGIEMLLWLQLMLLNLVLILQLNVGIRVICNNSSRNETAATFYHSFAPPHDSAL
jgi:hypothetical protein